MARNLLLGTISSLLLCVLFVNNAVLGAADAGNEDIPTRLRGTYHGSPNSINYSINYGDATYEAMNNDGDAQDVHFWSTHQSDTTYHRSLQGEEEEGDNVYILTQPLAFQISMSIILSIIALTQLALLATFIYHRSKRVLEFAQPLYLCIMITSGIIATGSCYLYLYISTPGCTLREPLIFISLTVMGSTIAGRAWRISTLMSNPIMTGNGASGDNGASSTNGRGSKKVFRVERARQFILQAISSLSGCDYSIRSVMDIRRRNRGGGGGRPLRVQITFSQMMRAILILCVPQLALQVLVMGVPALRSSATISYTENFGATIGQYDCQSSAPGSWPMYISVLFTILPYICAYILNIRPRAEIERLPGIIDERSQLQDALAIFFRTVVATAPVIGMTYYYQAPAIRAYASILLVLAASISLSYYIGFAKLRSLKANQGNRRRNTLTSFASGDGGSGDGRSSAAFAVKMAEMYNKIGRTEETLELVDETLSYWKKGGSSGGILGNQEGREDIGGGFTKHDLKDLEPDELEMILQLHVIKGDALMKLHGPKGFPLSAQMNITAMKLFENCPAAKKMKDISIMFPIFNRVGIQIKGGVIDQDDSCSLEMDLAERFCHEAQVQSYHLARALGNLAEWYGRIGALEKAFKYFHTMTAIYMPKDHPPLINSAYAVDRCAITIAVSSLWYVQKGEIEKAIERCNQVEEEVLPTFDKNDVIGLFHIFIPIIRVFKWGGQVDRAREFFHKWSPEGVENHFAMGSSYKPICLLLEICDGSTAEYDTADLEADIEMIMDYDVSEMNERMLICDGWSFKSMVAEICLHLAGKLEPGDVSRGSLLDKGIQMSTAAIKSATASNGMIQHIIAYEAHKSIDDRLLALRRENNAVKRTIIYHGHEKMRKSLSIKAEEDHQRFSVANSINGSLRRNVSFDFASRFVVKSDTSNTNTAGRPIVSSSHKSSVSSKGSTKKRVFFSSKESKASAASQQSNHKSNSQDSLPKSSLHSLKSSHQSILKGSQLSLEHALKPTQSQRKNEEWNSNNLNTEPEPTAIAAGRALLIRPNILEQVDEPLASLKWNNNNLNTEPEPTAIAAGRALLLRPNILEQVDEPLDF